MQKVFEIFIKTTPEKLWEAITNPGLRRKYTFGVAIDTDWLPGSSYHGVTPTSPVPIFGGENMEVDPPRRLVQSFNAMWSDDVKREGTSRVRWEIAPAEDACLLTVTHDQLREGANEELTGGWPLILSGLKMLLETGHAPAAQGSLPHAQPR